MAKTRSRVNTRSRANTRSRVNTRGRVNTRSRVNILCHSIANERVFNYDFSYFILCNAVAGPITWNLCPINVRIATTIMTFRSRLKEHLFKTAYEH